MEIRTRAVTFSGMAATLLLAGGLGFAAGQRYGSPDAPLAPPVTPAPAPVADPPDRAAGDAEPVSEYLAWLGRLEEARARTSDSALPRLRQLSREMPRSEAASTEFADIAARLSEETMQNGTVFIQRTPPAPCAALARTYCDLLAADGMLAAGGMLRAHLATGEPGDSADPRAAAARRRAAAEAGVVEFKEAEARRAALLVLVNAELASLGARYPHAAGWRVR
jgi:hypothetical protein